MPKAHLITRLPGYALLLAALLPVMGAAASPLQLEGHKTQGGVLVGTVPAGSQVRLDDERLRVNRYGQFVVGFDRDAGPNARLLVDLPDGQQYQRELSIEQRQYDIQHIDGLPPAQVTPPQEVLDRIRRESAAIGQARRVDSDRSDFTGDWIWPAAGRITGVFGSQRILNGEPRRPHYGLDIAAPIGTPVYAPNAGEVVLVQMDNYYSGHTLIIDHGHELTSTYIHLEAIHVEEGQVVEQGQHIADIGETGRATGPHLDWRLNWRGRRMDPMLVMPSDTPPPQEQ